MPTFADTPDHIVFDLGGVILDPPPTLAPLRDRLRVPADVGEAEFLAAYSAPRSDYDRTSNDADYWRAVAAACGAPTPSGADIAALTEWDTDAWCQPEPGSLALVHDLATAGVGLAILSNAPHAVGEHIRSLAWSRLFSTIVISGEIDLVKPDPEIYRRLLADLDTDPGRVAFTDDLPANIAGANSVGIHGLLFTGADHLRRALADLGVPVGAGSS